MTVVDLDNILLLPYWLLEGSREVSTAQSTKTKFNAEIISTAIDFSRYVDAAPSLGRLLYLSREILVAELQYLKYFC